MTIDEFCIMDCAQCTATFLENLDFFFKLTDAVKKQAKIPYA